MTAATHHARWQGALLVALLSSLLAIAFGAPGLFYLAAVALGFVLVGQLSTPPTANLRIERDLSESRARPGQPVTVTVSVTNEGEGVLSDVRIADEPPAAVPVTNGSPAFATAIRPGETVTHEYELMPPRGTYEFGSTRCRLRSLSATTVTTEEHAADGERSLSCETVLDSFPFHERTIQFVGQTPTDDGGSGIEFFSTREYRRGDPINRIDWHRFARTGDLATVEYREERAVTIVFVLDDRDGVHCGVPGGGPDSYDLTLYAASRGVVASLEDGNRTGVVSLSGDTWIEPGADSGVRRQYEDAIADKASNRAATTAQGRNNRTAAAQSSPAANSSSEHPLTDGGSFALDLEKRLPRRAQVVLCTPLSDRGVVDLVETLRGRGRAVTVVSPDVTTGLGSASVSTGTRVAGLRRANRIDALRGLGTTVVDWNLADPISVDLARAFRTGAKSGRPRTRGGSR
ncbi:DUF58 domain-containing protein [Natrialbaceae archaeon A-arb3/5]